MSRLHDQLDCLKFLLFPLFKCKTILIEIRCKQHGILFCQIRCIEQSHSRFPAQQRTLVIHLIRKMSTQKLSHVPKIQINSMMQL